MKIMNSSFTFLAIIPARGGSKRLPRKNILDLAGKPLIAWSIEAGLKSNFIDTLVVSTDDEEIASVSKKFGADIPFMRPEYLATDTASSFDVVKHTIDFFNSQGKNFDYVVLLQPTSPLREAKQIDEAISMLISKKADAIISVSETEHSPLWSNTLPENGDLSNFIRDEAKNKRSQDLEKYYRLNGAIYICKTEKLLEQKSFFLRENIFAYKMERESSVDIDEKLDFLIASVLLMEKTKR